MYLSTSTSTDDFPEMYLSTFQVLYKLYLSTDVLKYKVLLPGSGEETRPLLRWKKDSGDSTTWETKKKDRSRDGWTVSTEI